MSYWKEKKGETAKEIERKRQELIKLYKKEGLSSKRVLRVSQDIDKLISNYYLVEKKEKKIFNENGAF